MFGAGFVMDMIQSLKNNKRNRITKFDKEVDKHTSIYGKLKDHKKNEPQRIYHFSRKIKSKQQTKQTQTIIGF